MTFGEWLKWFGNLFVKEILTYFIDPASRFILIVPLIIQIFLFGYTARFEPCTDRRFERIPRQIFSATGGSSRRISDFLYSSILAECFSDER